ncbi:MAG: hypothetical protein PHE88_07120 [Elusimicrobia bacterium]|nr:hypothetical protein [Elusimicrobiota bacterium]
MPFIKALLKEELGNSIRMKREYENALRKLPKGSLRPKKIHGHVYYYLALRVKDKVKDIYKGKLSEKIIKKHEKAKIFRAKYRNLLSQVKKQIKYLRGAIRGKEAI